MLQKLDVLFDHRHAGARLHKRAARPVGLAQLMIEALFGRDSLLIRERLVKIFHVPAGRPLVQHLLAHGEKLVVRHLPVFQFHLTETPSP